MSKQNILVCSVINCFLQLDRTEEDIVSILPDKAATLETIAIAKILSARGTKSLGEWEFQQQYDPMALKAEKE
jgi:hypothetical protein